MKRYRTITIGVITALVAAILGLLTEFGVGLTAKQQESILVVIAALGPLVAGLIEMFNERRDVPPPPPPIEGTHRVGE